MMTTEEYAQRAAEKYLRAWEHQGGCARPVSCGITHAANMLNKAAYALRLTMPGDKMEWWGTRYLALAEQIITSASSRGDFNGLCATEGCPRMSRWIPISHVSTKPQPFQYYCAPCCDAIAERRVS